MRVVSGSGDRTVKVWDAETGRELLTLQGHTNTVTTVAVTPDGKRVVSASDDRTVRLWDSTTGYETMALKMTKEGVRAMSVSPDGKRIFAVGTNSVKVWDASMSQQKP
jgi:WD40 repeat protein